MIRRLVSQHGLAILALVVALSGTAYAAAALPRNSVKARQIAPQAVGTSELRANAVSGGKVRNGSIGLSDLAPGARPPAAPLVRQFGTTNAGPLCNDEDDAGTQVGTICASVAVDLDRTSSLTIQAQANWGTTAFDDTLGPQSATDSTTGVNGFCVVRLDATAVPGSLVRSGERAASAGAGPTTTPSGYVTGSTATNGFTASVPAGSHVVDLECTEVDGDMLWFRGGLTVTAAPLS